MREEEAITRFCPHVPKFENCLAGACMEWQSEYKTEPEKKMIEVKLSRPANESYAYSDVLAKEMIDQVPEGWAISYGGTTASQDGFTYQVEITRPIKTKRGKCTFKRGYE